MIAVDTNILVYAHREDASFHDVAIACIRELAQGRGLWCIPWPCIHEFFAIATHPRIFAPPTPAGKVIDQIEAWLESPTLTLLAESNAHWGELQRLLVGARISGPQVHDARVAALCIQHGVRELWTADRDFSRFAGLVAVNPLIGR